jgi:short-subunit dehydrogenase
MDLTKYGPWAVVTGGSEGIGASFARRFAAAGINVVLFARSEGPLDALAAELRRDHGIEVRARSLDLGDYTAIDRAREVTDDIDVGFLAYTAGANKIRGNFIDLEPRVYRDQIGINVVNQAEFLHHYGALMKPRGRGGIVMCGSTASYLGAETLATYCGVKAFSRLWTEAIWAECQPMGIDVLHLVINFTATPAMVRAGYDISKAQAPDEVVAEALDALGREPVHIMGGTAAQEMMARRNGIENRGDLIRSIATPRREEGPRAA